MQSDFFHKTHLRGDNGHHKYSKATQINKIKNKKFWKGFCECDFQRDATG